MRLLQRRGEIEPRLTWILGSPRSGSTWLLNLMAAAPRTVKIDEPAIGAHLAVLMSGLLGLRAERVPPGRMRLNDVRVDSADYFFSAAYASVWRPELRRLILRRLGAQAEEEAKRRGFTKPTILIKEPHGSQAADILMSLLPRSRLLFLVRDGRDSLDSALDAASAQSWATRKMDGYRTADRERESFLVDRANAWLCRIDALQRAYSAHSPRLRLMVRYEDLLADPAPQLTRILEWADLEHSAQDVEAAIDSLAAAKVHPSQRGPGRFVRAARVGTWRESWTVQEQQAVLAVIGDKLADLGYQ